MYNQPYNNYYQPATYNPNLSGNYSGLSYNNMNNNMQSKQNDNNQNSINIVYVNGYEAAKDVILQPNQRVWIMNNNANEFYIKTSDSMGVSTLDCYEFQKIDKSAKENSILSKSVDYIKRDEFDALKNKIEALEKNLTSKTKTSKKADD